MQKLAILMGYPLQAVAAQLGIKPPQLLGAVPMLNLLEGLRGVGGFQIDVVTTSKIVSATRRLPLDDNMRLHVVRVPRYSGMPVGFLPRIPLLHRYLDELKPDLVHGQGTEVEFGVMAVTSRFPSVLTVHGILSEVHKVARPGWTSPLRVGRWVEAVTLRRARHIIAISPYVERALAAKTRAQFHRVPNAVAPIFYEVSKGPLEPTVVYSARIAPYKGLWDLLQAAHRLHGKGIKAQWKILGTTTGPQGTTYFARCREFARENLNGQQMQFMGWLTQGEFTEVLRSASCLAHPSYCENFPMVIAEAMASGTPVVAYAVGGIPDLVEDGVEGFLVPPGDTHLLACRIETLVKNPNLAKAMGERAREKAQAFRQAAVAARTLAVYEQILRSAGSPPAKG